MPDSSGDNFRNAPGATSISSHVSIREAQDAAMHLGDARTERIVGPGGLSGASPESLRTLVNEANSSRTPNPLEAKLRERLASEGPILRDARLDLRSGQVRESEVKPLMKSGKELRQMLKDRMAGRAAARQISSIFDEIRQIPRAQRIATNAGRDAHQRLEPTINSLNRSALVHAASTLHKSGIGRDAVAHRGGNGYTNYKPIAQSSAEALRNHIRQKLSIYTGVTVHHRRHLT